MEPTSEQELKQLLDEGKITEEEYKELLEALRQKEIVQRPFEVDQQSTDSKPPTGYGKVALILFIFSIILPVLAVLFGLLLSYAGIKVFLIVPFIPIALLCALLAFILGIIGWKTTPGKVAAIGVPCLGLLVVPGFLLLSLLIVRVTHVPSEQPNTLSPAVAEIQRTYPLDTLEGLLSQNAAVIDENIYVNGGGSLKIESDSSEKRIIRLFDTGPMNIQNQMLIYSAQLKSQLQQGQAYLEMWCSFPGKGEFFSRDIEQPITGTTNWTTVQTPFRLEAGQSPDNIKLNLIIEGIGTVWIDDIKLLSSPLN